MTRRRKLSIAIPSAYVVLLILVTSISHAARSGHPTIPVADAPSPTSSTSSAVAPTQAARAPANSTPHARERLASNGDVLPDPSATPGAIDPKVRQSNISTLICHSGYSSSVRSHSVSTNSLKQRQLRAGYTYDGDTTAADYEEDHLISLELGGSPTSVKNLWPEPYDASGGARKKDKIEDELHDLVCAHSLTLAAAQQAEATDWSAAYYRYITEPAKAKAAKTAKAAAQRAAAQRKARQEARSSRAAAASSAATPRPATSCTTTSSGSCIQGGEFCPESSYGNQGTDANGNVYTCQGDSDHPHWED